jgi:thioester reductase-like protein/FkbH-like protein
VQDHQNRARESTAVSVRIAANFTAEPIGSSISFWLDTLEIASAVSFAPYDQVVQQLIDPNSALNSVSGYRVVLCHLTDWRRGRDPHATTAERLARFADLVDGLCEAIAAAPGRAPLIVGLCPDIDDAAIREARRRIDDVCAGAPGVSLLDLSDTPARYSVREIFNPHATREGHIPFTRPCLIALGTGVARAVAAASRAPLKAVVVDCDDTLWAGLCGELGPDGVAVTPPHADLQQRLAVLRRAGVLVCLCSKNAEQPVFDVFVRAPGMILTLDDIVAHRINWRPKSRNVLELATELDIALDSIAFLDDRPSERAEVRAECPGVVVPDLPEATADWPAFFDHYWLFDVAASTTADRDRTVQYRQRAERERARRRFESLDDFLAHLNVVVDVSALRDADIARASQLTVRTTQFTTSATAHPETAVRAWMADPSLHCEIVQVSDRYGDYGTVGLLTVRTDGGVASVETLALSCRVLGKRVEHRIISRVIDVARASACDRVRIRVAVTSRNQPVRDFIAALDGELVRDVAAIVYEWRTDELAARLDTALTDRPRNEDVSPERADDAPPSGGARSRAEILDQIAALTSAAEIEVAIRAARARPREGVGTLPRTPIEQAIAGLWETILDVVPVGVHDRFFDLGGDSLKLAELVATLHERFGIGLSLGALQNPTLEEVAALIGSSRGAGVRLRTEPALAADAVLERSISLDGRSAAHLPPRRIVLTGATGFLGSYLLAELVARTDAEVTCFVRAPDEASALERLSASARTYGLPSIDVQRIHATPADLTCERFDLSGETYDALAADTDAIVHCGACVNFVYDYYSLKPVNVDGTRRILEFATTTRTKAIHHISTLGMLMSAERPAGGRVLEREPPAFERGLPNGYEQSKWVADSLMHRAADRGLPIAVYRPGMLVGDMQTGTFAKPNEFASCMIKGCIQLGCAPDADTVVELVPIDYVAALVVEIYRRDTSLGQVFHLNHPEPLRMRDVIELLNRCGYPVVPVPFAEWKRRFFKLGHQLRENALFPFVGFIHQLEERHIIMPDIDDANARRIAAESGLTAVPMCAVMERVMAYFQREGFLDIAPTGW